MGIIHACGFLLPSLFLGYGGAASGLLAAQIATILFIRLLISWRFRTSWWSAVLHPLSEVLMMAIGLNSWRRMATKGVTWKGRTYQASGV